MVYSRFSFVFVSIQPWEKASGENTINKMRIAGLFTKLLFLINLIILFNKYKYSLSSLNLLYPILYINSGIASYTLGVKGKQNIFTIES